MILLLCMAFSGCSEIGKLVQDVDNSDNPGFPTELLNSHFYIQNDMYYHRPDHVL